MEAFQSIVTSIEQFSTKFYKLLVERDGHDNLVCSPMSVSIVLSMAASGAYGNTKAELCSGRSLSDDTKTQNGYKLLIDTLNSIKSCELHLANRIFTAHNFEVDPQFEIIQETLFGATIQNVDFNRPSEACDIINNWCAEQTNNRITNLIKPGEVGSGTGVVLVNAVYFKGTWRESFNKFCTQSLPFDINEQIKKNIPTMYKSGCYNYGPLLNLDAHYIELPYKSNSLTDSVSMFIILPNTINGLNEIEQNLDKIHFKKLHEERNFVDIILTLPKFKITSELNLGDILIKMKMQKMFSSFENFEGIMNIPLEMITVKQKAFLEVNEKGSEAAAATTSMDMMAFGGSMPQPVEVRVNRPFFCTIIATHSGTQLFNARVIDPVV